MESDNIQAQGEDGMHSVLVTGSSGFVAQHLIPALKSRGCKVQGLDIRAQNDAIRASYTHFDGDIRHAGDVARAASGVDTIIHLAAEHKDFGVAAAEYQSVNVDGMAELLACAKKNGIRRFVFYSSVAVYGDVPGGSTEETVPNPVSEYGKSKLLAEELLLEWRNQESSNNALIFRPTVIYGEYNTANMYRLIETIWRKRYVQVGQGINRKSIVYIGNAIAATMHLIDNLHSGPSIYNFSDSPAWTSRRIAETVAMDLGRSLPRVRIPASVGIVLAKPADWVAKLTGIDLPITAARISKYLTDSIHNCDGLDGAGFVPPFQQDEGIRKMVAWYKKRLND